MKECEKVLHSLVSFSYPVELMERRREQRRERQFTRAASTPQHYSTSTYNRFDRSRGYERSHLHDYERTSSTSLPPSSSLPALARRADHERVTSTMRTMGRNTNRPNSSPPSSVTNSNDTHRNRDRERNNERDRARQHADDIDAPGDDNLFPLTAGELGVGARANGGLEANGGVGLVQVEDAVEPGWRKPTAQELIDTPEQVRTLKRFLASFLITLSTVRSCAARHRNGLLHRVDTTLTRR